MSLSRISGPRPACVVCGDEATHTGESSALCPDHAAAYDAERQAAEDEYDEMYPQGESR